MLIVVDLHQRLSDSRLQIRFLVKLHDEKFGDLRLIDIDIGLHRDIDLRARGMSG